jgi:HTH-type transcriptional regulator / antitoxin HipB
MIQNEHQYKVTKGEIEKLQEVIEKILLEKDSLNERQIVSMQATFQTQIDRMNAEIEEYENLKAGKVDIKMSSIEDLPKALIQKRISLDMTQRQLAEKLGIKEQMVQRYESNNYESASLHRLTEVWKALDLAMPEVIMAK